MPLLRSSEWTRFVTGTFSRLRSANCWEMANRGGWCPARAVPSCANRKRGSRVVQHRKAGRGMSRGTRWRRSRRSPHHRRIATPMSSASGRGCADRSAILHARRMILAALWSLTSPSCTAYPSDTRALDAGRNECRSSAGGISALSRQGVLEPVHGPAVRCCNRRAMTALCSTA